MLPIHQISLPTQGAGRVHVYVIRQEPVTLIDTGFYTPESREALTEGLRSLGLAVRDIRRILITHAHSDHVGGAGWIASESGAEVFLHPDEAGKVETPDWWVEGRDQVLRESGVPAETQQLMQHFWEHLRRMISTLEGWRPLQDGQEFAFEGGSLKAVHLPGHALGHTGFYEEASRRLIGGDHLLDRITPNPIMEPVPPGYPDAVPHAPVRALTLAQFMAALRRVSDLEVSSVLPGHGPIITDHRAVVETYTLRHERRLETLLRQLGSGREPWDLTREVYPRAKGVDLFLALSEVLAHLDLLVVRGLARLESRANRSWYAPAANLAG